MEQAVMEQADKLLIDHEDMYLIIQTIDLIDTSQSLEPIPTRGGFRHYERLARGNI